MMKVLEQLSAPEIYNDILSLCEIIDKTDFADKHSVKSSNKKGEELSQYDEFLAANKEMAIIVYSMLLGCDNVTAQIHAAASAMRLNLLMKQAVKLLETLSARKDIGIRAFNANMVLRVWRGEFPGKTL